MVTRQKLKIGDVGKLNGRVFERETDLKSLGIEFKVSKDTSKMDLDYKSEGSVNITPKLAGEAPLLGSSLAAADAGITVSFTKEKSIAFEANGVLLHQVADLVPIKQEMIKRFKEKTWEKEWVVITELAVADSATILISSKSNTQIDLRAKTDIKANELKLASVQAAFQLMNSSGLETKFLAEQELTPLYKCIGIKTNIFGGGTTVETKGDDTEILIGEIDFE